MAWIETQTEFIDTVTVDRPTYLQQYVLNLLCATVCLNLYYKGVSGAKLLYYALASKPKNMILIYDTRKIDRY